MKTLRIASAAIFALAVSALAIPNAAGAAQGTQLKSPDNTKGGWYCLIWEKVGDKWVCRLQELRQ
jgi:invasion protein IalB